MKIFSIFLSLMLFTGSAYSQSTKWNFDNSHANVRFSVSHMMISNVEGQFKEFEGNALSDKNDFSDLKIDFSLKVASINTNSADRDKHLISADFFNVTKYPEITFQSKSMKKASKSKYKLTGYFTMLGVKKIITLDVIFVGIIKDPWGNTRAGFKLTGTINRNDWGLKYNSVMDSGSLMIGEEVEISCNIELIKAK